MRDCNYSIFKTTPKSVVLSDQGPWNEYSTITNAAENVVEQLFKSNVLNGRRLYYYDSEGDFGELEYDPANGKFKGFKFSTPEDVQ